MTDIVKSTTVVTPDAFSGSVAPRITVNVAGAASAELPYASPCYVASTGKVALSVSTVTLDTTVTEAVDSDAGTVTLKYSKCNGFTPKTYANGANAVTLFGNGTILPGYATGLTPGAYYYVSDTAGKLATTAQAAGDRPVAWALNTTDIVVCNVQ